MAAARPRVPRAPAGAGILAAALRAGIPSVPHPERAGQPSSTPPGRPRRRSRRTSRPNTAADNIALLDLAISRLRTAAGAGCWCRREAGRKPVVGASPPTSARLDGAGFSHQLLEHIAPGAGVTGRRWEFSVGWSCTDTELDAIAGLPTGAWTAGIDQNGELLDDTFVAD